MRSLADEMFPDLTDAEIEELVTNVPPKDRRLITSSVDFSISTLIGYMRDKTITVPEFQRKYVWSQIKASRLIESLIMQCPVPVIYLSRRADGILEVVDGNQRLSSIRRFVDGHFSLKGLTAFPELTGNTYEQLDARFQRHIQSKTIRCVIIEAESHPQIKFDVFERLNSGSTPLNAQELRNGLYSGPFMELLHELSVDPTFAKLTGLKADTRMKREELALRFFAFKDEVEFYEKPLAAFLNGYCERKRNAPLQEIAELREQFVRTLKQLELVFGEKVFRLPGVSSSAAKFNTAYFDAMAVGFARSNLSDLPDMELARLAPRVVASTSQLVAEHTFLTSVTRATSDDTAVLYRIFSMRDVINSVE